MPARAASVGCSECRLQRASAAASVGCSECRLQRVSAAASVGCSERRLQRASAAASVGAKKSVTILETRGRCLRQRVPTFFSPFSCRIRGSLGTALVVIVNDRRETRKHAFARCFARSDLNPLNGAASARRAKDAVMEERSCRKPQVERRDQNDTPRAHVQPAASMRRLFLAPTQRAARSRPPITSPLGSTKSRSTGTSTPIRRMPPVIMSMLRLSASDHAR